MKSIVEALLEQALNTLKKQSTVPSDLRVVIRVDRTKEASHGDFASNVALMLAKPCEASPAVVAQWLVDVIPTHPLLERVQIAGPGFINFFMRLASRAEIIQMVLQAGDAFGRSAHGCGQKVILEYVSANPTGPLHVGHGRGAALGASLANLLTTTGYQVNREYYVNDAGRQMDILAVSVWLRYLKEAGEPVIFPENGYRGDYVYTIAEQLYAQCERAYVHPWILITQELPKDEPEGGDKEVYIDALIKCARNCLGESGFAVFHQHALTFVLDDIKDDLAAFGVEYDTWFSEQSLVDSGAILSGIDALKKTGYTYEQEEALWFRSTAFGDEKDRVLIRSNGQTTYFASDVAYHWNKYQRGFKCVIDLFGADHHGYIPRLKAVVTALGHDETALNILLVQFALLYRDGVRVQMSTRSGSFVTLRELREEVGCDAARFFYVMRKPEQHMDFDLSLAKSQSNDNPVYYIQYAHARICSVLKQCAAKDLVMDEALGLQHLDLLTAPHEGALIELIDRYPSLLISASNMREPHLIAYYLRELATALHAYYNAVPLLCEDLMLRSTRLCLLLAVRQVLRNGMHILGVSAPESM